MRTSEPWLATVLPVLNEEAHIEACLQSLLCQSLPANEHIIMVLDGGSTDATKDIVHTIQSGLKPTQHPVLHLLDNPGRFVPHARNLALQQLPDSITHVLEFNGHIEVEPTHLVDLKRIWDRLESDHPQLAGLGCRVLGSEMRQGRMEQIIDSTLRSPLGGSTGQFAVFNQEGPTNVPAFALHRRMALETIGGWDESFLTSQDSDLSMRLKKAGFAVVSNSGRRCQHAKKNLIQIMVSDESPLWFLENQSPPQTSSAHCSAGIFTAAGLNWDFCTVDVQSSSGNNPRFRLRNSSTPYGNVTFQKRPTQRLGGSVVSRSASYRFYHRPD